MMPAKHYIFNEDCRDVLAAMPAYSVNCCVTSPPYWGLRDYGTDRQIGQEPTLEEYVGTLVDVFHEVRRILKPDGTLWVNMGDGYARQGGSGKGAKNRELAHLEGKQKRCCKPPAGRRHKDLLGQPWLLAFALQADGWYLRQDIIWHKTNPMPESVKDRCTKAHEYVFLLSKEPRYYFDHTALREHAKKGAAGSRFDKGKTGEGNSLGRAKQGYRDSAFRNARSVWTIPTQPYRGAHFATFPEELARRCILAGCPSGGTVLDPFAGSGTVGQVAKHYGRNSILIEGNASYCDLIRQRLDTPPRLAIT